MADEKMENLSVEAGIPDPSLLLRCSTQPSKESGAHVEKGAVTDNCVPNGFVRHCSEGEIISKLDSREQSLDKSAGDTATDSEKTSNCNIVTEPSSKSNCLSESNISSKEKVLEVLETEQCSCDHSLQESLAQVAITDTNIAEETKSEIIDGINYVVYKNEHQMPDIMRLITKDLSEPYSIYTYRYFIHNWPKLCFLAMDGEKCVGAIVCKLDMHKKMVRRGYIAMLAVDQDYRRKKIGSKLVLKAIHAMIADDCDEVVLETEITNKAALRLYEKLGFVRDKRLFRYYLNGVDALRLKLWLR